MVSQQDSIDAVVKKIIEQGKEKVKFILLYGSVAEGKQTPLSDIDLAIYYDDDKEQRFRFRMKMSGMVEDRFDIQIFQDLPLYVKNEVVKGKVLYCADQRFLYEMNRETYRDFEQFKYRFYDYIKGGIIS